METETIHDVARNDGVGAGTYSWVLSNIPSVNKDARTVGLAIPHYLSIIGYNEIALAHYWRLTLDHDTYADCLDVNVAVA